MLGHVVSGCLEVCFIARQWGSTPSFLWRSEFKATSVTYLEIWRRDGHGDFRNQQGTLRDYTLIWGTVSFQEQGERKMSLELSTSLWPPFWKKSLSLLSLSLSFPFSFSLGLELGGKNIDMIPKKKALPLWPDEWHMMEPISPFLLKRKEKNQNFNFQSKVSF